MATATPARTITAADITGPDAPRIQRIVAENRAKPTEGDFKGRKGYWRKYRPNGSYQWGYRYAPNDGHGKLSKASHEVMEMMSPSMQMQQNRMGGPGAYPGRGRGRCVAIARRNGAWMRALPDGSWAIGGIAIIGVHETTPDGVQWCSDGAGTWEVVA